jgi:Uma2 family endonuclease
MGSFDTRVPRVSLEQFHAFRDERPKEEKWELIDGVLVMMPPPTLVHQRIAKNLETLLTARLAITQPDWSADREIGVLLPDDDRFNPEPDVTVIDTAIEIDQLYATKFYFVAEVMSPNDKPIVLELKRDYYQRHAACRGILFIRQDRVEAEMFVRQGEAWNARVLNDATMNIEIPDIGEIGTLAQLYRHTPLVP